MTMPLGSNSVIVQVVLTKKQYGALKDQAKYEGLSASSWVRVLVLAALRAAKRQAD